MFVPLAVPRSSTPWWRSVAELDGRTTLLVIVKRPPGATVALTIKRGQELRTINVTVRAADY